MCDDEAYSTVKEAPVAHGRDKPGKEKRKPKQSKSAAPKPSRNNEVLEHVAQHPRAEDAG